MMDYLKTVKLAFVSATVISAGGALYHSDASHPHGMFNPHHSTYDAVIDQEKTVSDLQQDIADGKTDILQAIIDNNASAASGENWSIGLGVSLAGFFGASTLLRRREEEVDKEVAKAIKEIEQRNAKAPKDISPKSPKS